MAALNNEPDLASLQSDLAALKRDMASLIEHLSTGAGKTAHDAAGQIDDSARKLYRNVAENGDRSLRAIEAQVEAQPLVALLIAIGLGYLGGRLLAR